MNYTKICNEKFSSLGQESRTKRVNITRQNKSTAVREDNTFYRETGRVRKRAAVTEMLQAGSAEHCELKTKIAAVTSKRMNITKFSTIV